MAYIIIIQSEREKALALESYSKGPANINLFPIQSVSTHLVVDSKKEAIDSMNHFKYLVEQRGINRLFHEGGKNIKEKKLQDLIFLSINKTSSFVGRECYTGRGNVDFIFALGEFDKTVVEVKLGSASKKALKHGLTNQLEIYKKSLNTTKSVSVIVYFDDKQKRKIERLLEELNLLNNPGVITINGQKKEHSASNLKAIV